MREVNLFLYTAAQLNARQQDELIENLRTIFSASEIVAIQTGIAYFRMLLYPRMKDEICREMAAQLYKVFTEHKERT